MDSKESNKIHRETGRMIWKHATLEDHKLLTRDLGRHIRTDLYPVCFLKGMSKAFRRFLTLRTKAQKIWGLFTGKAFLSCMLYLVNTVWKNWQEKRS